MSTAGSGAKPPRQVLPQGSYPCVWMSAGQVAYKLCDRNFECEDCPLDQALRGQGQAGDARPADPAPLPGPAAPEFPDDRVYGPGHTWAGVLDDRHVRVGLDAFAASLLLHASGVVLPAPGSAVEKGRSAFWITDGSSTVALRSPVAGSVVRRNPRLREHPALAAESPYEDGWLVEIECRDAVKATRDLEGHDAARDRASSDLARFREVAHEATRSGGDGVGPTLLDGGTPSPDLRKALGAERYYALVARMLG